MNLMRGLALRIFCLINPVVSAGGFFDFDITVAGISFGADDLPFDLSFTVNADAQSLLGVSCDVSTLAQPQLALAQPFVNEFGQNVLLLNAGPYAADRILYNTDDNDGPIDFNVSGLNGNVTVSSTFNGRDAILSCCCTSSLLKPCSPAAQKVNVDG